MPLPTPDAYSPVAERSSRLRSLPKVELHLHLDCSLSYEVVQTLAPEITRDAYREEFIAPPKCSGLVDYLDRAPVAIRLMQSSEALRLVTHDLFRQLAADGVVYAEIRFAPLLHLDEDLSPDAVVQSVNEAAREASRETGVHARLILCTLRHFGKAESLETVDLVARHRRAPGSLVAGFDIAADEAGYPIEPHVPAFALARQLGIPATAHAGEALGASSVTETLDRLRPSRIGHGVRSVENPSVVRRIREENIHLEICPSSNVQTDVVDTFQDHPIDSLYRAGVDLGVNTDARTITNVCLTGEYERLVDTFGWRLHDLLACNRMAMRASFAPSALQAEILESLNAAYGRALGEHGARM